VGVFGETKENEMPKRLKIKMINRNTKLKYCILINEGTLIIKIKWVFTAGPEKILTVGFFTGFR